MRMSVAAVTRAHPNTLKARLFYGLSHPSRVSILDALRAGPLTVTGIARVTGLGQSNVSNHLKSLKAADLVTSEQAGRSVLYQLSDERVSMLLRLAEEYLAELTQSAYESARESLTGRR